METFKVEPRDGWYVKKGYLHLDKILPFEEAKTLVENPEAVAKHSFLPFMFYNQMTPKHTVCDGRIQTKMKERPINYPCHKDGYIFSYYYKILSEAYEAELEKRNMSHVVSACRKLGKSNGEFAAEAFAEIGRMGTCSAITLDFSKFFDKIDHKLLKKQWKMLLGLNTLPPDHYAVFKAITKFSRVDKKAVDKKFKVKSTNPREFREVESKGRKIFKAHRQSIVSNISEFRNWIKTEKVLSFNPEKNAGIPQGSSISAFLSNLFMIDFDQEMMEYVESFGGIYRRYVDDIMLVVPTEMYQDTIAKAKELEKKFKTKLNEEKTTISHFERKSNGELIVRGDTTGMARDDSGILQYLGFMFDGKDITIRDESYNRYLIKRKAGIKMAMRTKKKYDALALIKGIKPSDNVKMRKLYLAYTLRGYRNFPAYVMRMAKIVEGYKRNPETGKWDKVMDTGLSGKALRNQIANVNVELRKEVKKHQKMLSKRQGIYRRKTKTERMLTDEQFNSLYK